LLWHPANTLVILTERSTKINCESFDTDRPRAIAMMKTTIKHEDKGRHSKLLHMPI
jgi:hypothetical protein